MSYTGKQSRRNSSFGGDHGFQNNQGYNHSDYGYQRNQGFNTPKKKRSGAKLSRITKGKGQGMWSVHAWNYSRSKGLITVKGFQNTKSTKYSNASGEESSSIMLEIFYKRTGAKWLELCWIKENTGKIHIDSLGMVISTKAPNGGYFGKH